MEESKKKKISCLRIMAYIGAILGTIGGLIFFYMVKDTMASANCFGVAALFLWNINLGIF